MRSADSLSPVRGPSPLGHGLQSLIAHTRLLFALACLAACAAGRGSTTPAPPPGGATQAWGRSRPLLVERSGAREGFTLMAGSRTGVQFTNQISVERSLTNHVLLNGSGVACGDVDGDGRVDIFFCGIDGDNALYLNQGDWKFREVAAEAGVACPGLDCTGAALADVDGDGDLDLLIGTLGQGIRLFLNDGKGRFTDVSATSGLGGRGGNMSLALADIDGDGDLDLYVVNYRTSTMRDSFNLRLKVGMVDGHREVTHVDGRPVTEPDLAGRFSLLPGGGFVENGEADQLFKNDGHGHFTLVPFTGGAFLDESGRPLASPPYDWGLSAMFRDLNADGSPDLYVCNDLQSPDRVWINRGDGTFRALAPIGLRETSWFSMGVDVADLDHDGRYDFMVADMLARDHRHRQTQDNAMRVSPRPFASPGERLQTARSTLFLGRGGEEWAEVAWFAGVAATDWAWCPVFLDVDLDGHEDLLLTTGFERDVQDMDVAREIEAERRQRRLSDREGLRLRLRFPPLAQPNLAFRNRGDLTFEEIGHKWGFDLEGVSQGIALADLDGDGDLDVVLNNLNSPATLLRNDAQAPRIAVRLRGRGGNTQGIGSELALTGGPVFQHQEMVAGGRYLSSDDPARTFAASPVHGVLELAVSWRSGARSRISPVEPDHLYEITEPDSTPESGTRGLRPPPMAGRTLFESADALLHGHLHPEVEFDDFERQPLLPRRLSQLGPAVAWFDLDGDGWEDLILGAGRGGDLGVLRNDGKGGFTRLECPAFSKAPDDLVGIVGFVAPGNLRRVAVGVANYESPSTNRPALLLADIAVKETRLEVRVVQTLPPGPESIGPVAMGDLNLDGQLDLFTGGRVAAGRYPEAVASKLWRATPGGFIPDAENSRLLERVGMVSAALFGDFNGDGAPDLLLALEWGELRLYVNEGGRLREATAGWGLSGRPGWWTSIATGDFNGDGRLDFVAGNWGVNHVGGHGTERVLFGDLDGNGTFDVVSAYDEPGTGRLLPRATFDRLGEALPFIRSRFQGYGEYAQATLEQILGEEIRAAARLSASSFESTLFLNTGSSFRAVALPREAQLAPAFGLAVADFDGDGDLDLFVAQNFFATEPHTDRLDAGRGLLLLGDGVGGFRPVDAMESGIRIHGEQRGAGAADFDHDGRVDLVVAQNAGPTRLYRNTGAAPGLRVRVQLASAGRDAIGALVRPVYATGVLGPAQELQAGGGYWSQQSGTLVFGRRDLISSLWIRWPGGATSTIKVPGGTAEIVVDEHGQVR